MCLLYSPSSHLSCVSPSGFISGLSGFSGKGPSLTNVYFLLPTHFIFSSFLLSLPWFSFYLTPNPPVFGLFSPSFCFLSFSPPLFLYWPILLYPAQWLLRSAVPCCSYQFERMFDTCRIPGTLTGSIYIFTQQA